MLRSVGAFFLAALLAVVSSSSFRQTLSEFRDAEPGSLLFGTLHLVIATSGALAAIGVLKRTRWAAPMVILCGGAAAGLLAVQPLFEPMASDEQREIWLGAAAVAAAAIALSWFARRLARTTHRSGVPEGSATDPRLALQPPSPPTRSDLMATELATSTMDHTRREADPSSP